MLTEAVVVRGATEPIRVETVEIGDLRAGEVLVRIVGTGICHTDLGVIATATNGAPPIVLGHEGSGVIEAVGVDAGGLAVGDRVVLSYNHCRHCDNCVGGLPMHCRDFVGLNLAGHRLDGSSPLAGPGGEAILGHFFGQSSWSRLAVTTAANCVRVEDDVPLELLGPLGCGIQTGAGAVLNTLAPPRGSSIAVFGCGSVGMAAILAAVVADCGAIIAVDINGDRLIKAAELGATHIVNPAETDAADTIRAITGGAGAQYSVDCIGHGSVVRSALECLQSPGVCASVGFQGASNEITIDQGHLLFGRSLVGVIEGDAIPAQFIPRMIELYQAGRFPFDRIIDTFDFADINAAIEAVHAGSVIKAVLTCADPSGADR
ncbi:NAD(P)-dependent alcohol dehydrogenase [Nocardia jiangxiensis]|uniref:NAD(P)-dependent alcohol dehydrogenase n=1 Tax=Nocardia jiangxiensis TaxID=282685 RepID=UPI00030BD66A|nr:NAD(P)-dependent alcohol dehydrogenase [Nocardia jiangxiensis]